MDKIDRSETIFLTISRDMERVEDILTRAIEGSQVPVIKEVASHILFSGGKRFRPALAILSAKICGYSGAATPHLGAAIELIHTASLIHDDVLDSADTRRGVSSANARWGNHLSILVGDYCLSMASQILARETNQEIISLLTGAAGETTEGEVLEAVYSNDIFMDVDTYMNIIRFKTACLIAASCEAGSVLAEAPPRLSAALKDYGMNLGMAFQIIDDVLDYTMESSRLGKMKGTDLKEGKITLPVIYTLTRCTPEEKGIIKESLLAPTYSEDHFESVTSILDKYGCIQDSKSTAEKFLATAGECLAPFRTSLEKEALVKLTNFVLNRTS